MVHGNLKPGSTIQTCQITKELGISKTPLRDALIKLEAEGFVTILPQRGVVINSLTPEDVGFICEILGGLESRVIISVFHKIGEKEVAELNRINQEMVAIASLNGENFTEYNQKNIQFHDVFLNLSENALLLRYIRILKHRLYHFPDRDFGRDWQHINVAEHQKFVRLVEEHKPKQAADFMRDVHWHSAFGFVARRRR
jgi:DNA-binding GntR family transcriptional regulator